VSTPIFIFSPEGPTGDAWNLPNNSARSDIGEHWAEMYFHIVFWLYGLKPMEMELCSSAVLITFSFVVMPQVLHRLAAVPVQTVAPSGAGRRAASKEHGAFGYLWRAGRM